MGYERQKLSEVKRQHSLIDKIYNEHNLREAFKSVKRNQGAPGIDGETVQQFAEIGRAHV